MMNDEQITALAKGMVPFVRQCVTESVASIAARLTELEARPTIPGPVGPKGDKGEQGMAGRNADEQVPLDLAIELANAARLLHESPDFEEHKEAPRPPPRVTRIKRDEEGNFIPVYDE